MVGLVALIVFWDRYNFSEASPDFLLLFVFPIWLLTGSAIVLAGAVKGRSTWSKVLGTVALLMSVLMLSSYYPNPLGPGPSGGAAAISSLRTINTLQVIYMNSSDGYYGGLQELIDKGLLDERYSGAVGGYVYEIVLSDDGENDARNSYVATAVPLPDGLGRYGYYSGPDGVVRYGSEPDPGPDLIGKPVQ